MIEWPNGKKSAVTLSYDDGLPHHKDYVAPLLEEYGLRGTFYISGSSLRLVKDPLEWKKISDAGHELGNHSLFHPCRMTDQSKTWLDETYDMRKYSVKRFKDEISMTNLMLKFIDGKDERSYAATCGDMIIGEKDEEIFIGDIIDDMVIGIRGGLKGKYLIPTKEEELLLVPCQGGDFKSFENIKNNIEESIRNGGWFVNIVHGVGKGFHGAYIKRDEHLKLAKWLNEKSEDIWVAPFCDVALYIKKYEFNDSINNAHPIC